MGSQPHLTRSVYQDVTLLEDSGRPSGVTLAFTERTGGVSQGSYASLNVGADCGDDPAAVGENRRRLLAAVGAEQLLDRLVNPLQVHGDRVVLVTEGTAEAIVRAQKDARDGADAVVCTAANVPVLICAADCVPVVLVAPDGFAAIHSGWRGTEACIVGKALDQLCVATGCAPADVLAYVGPHIGCEDYEVSQELAERFAQSFGASAIEGSKHLDLGWCIRQTLVDRGVNPASICDECPSTAQATDRFYSWRAEGSQCGRHGVLAVRIDTDNQREVSADA